MATLETQQLDEIILSSRRKMLTLGGAALAGLAFSSVAEAQTTTLVDNDYLNFALNLEYLEAQFYTLATAGMTIDNAAFGIGITGTGTAGTVTTKGNNSYTSCKVLFPTTGPGALVQAYAMETAQEERNHVAFLRSALGGSAVAQPAIDLVNSFNYLAQHLNPSLPAFDPFADYASFLLGAYIFEDVGVTAYTGAAAALVSSGNLSAAAGIQAVEAYHAGLIRTTIYSIDQTSNIVNGTTYPAGTLSNLATRISVLRAAVDGTPTSSAHTQADDIGIGTQQVMLNGTVNVTAATIANASITGSINPTPTVPTTFPASTTPPVTSYSLVFPRTAAQVLSIVYAGGTTTANSGFFRAGLNGNVK